MAEKELLQEAVINEELVLLDETVITVINQKAKAGLQAEFALKPEYVSNIIAMLDEGNTIPFIARYRKEQTGSLDDQTLRDFADRLTYLRNLQKRKEEVSRILKEQGNYTEDLGAALDKAVTLTEVEDIYRPFKPKKKTRATVAVAKGLQPLADIILAQNLNQPLEQIAIEYTDDFISKNGGEPKGVKDILDAIAGACDIIAEIISDNADIRKALRELFFGQALIQTALDEKSIAKQQEAKKAKGGSGEKASFKEKVERHKVYEMYKDYSEPVSKIPSHRILAMNRGEKEDCLKVKVVQDEIVALQAIKFNFLHGVKPDTKVNKHTDEILRATIKDSYNRLIEPSIIREVRAELTDRASEQAIKMFKENLQPLLLQPPLKNNVVLGLDPGYRTGCKLAVVDATGKVLDTAVIYPTPPLSKTKEAAYITLGLIQKHKVDVVAIGNGTASKESEIFISELIKDSALDINYIVVNESGASVYSASKLAAEEFPEYDVAIRSAISIARRLQDPLAELIKIDVKSIGVGQYQHDMPQARLTDVLEGVVEDCVNSVGADLNTASVSLLKHIAGLNAKSAKAIVTHREKSGGFKTREQLLKVSGLGAKAYEQAAGFLRIIGGENILDNTAVHPESYDAAKKLLDFFKFAKDDVEKGKLAQLKSLIKKQGEARVAGEIGIGVPTLSDITDELIKPGRDIRDSLPPPVLRKDVMSLKDLKKDMELTGVVRNVIDFGAFIDIGVGQDGLVHLSQLSNKFIKHPSEVVKVGDVVKVKVMDVNLEKQRISLSMK
ncbi:MAG: RNA-binding transcriptional accessory protein [Firmicutes bacterium]|nr:RNA-binding transcriptional accessory protein [Bacillota bacterium]